MNLKNLIALTGLLLAVAGGTIAYNQISTSTDQPGCCAAKQACCVSEPSCCDENLVSAKAKPCCGQGACCSEGAECCDTGECCGTPVCCEDKSCCDASDAPECCKSNTAVKAKAPCCEASKTAVVGLQK